MFVSKGCKTAASAGKGDRGQTGSSGVAPRGAKEIKTGSENREPYRQGRRAGDRCRCGYNACGAVGGGLNGADLGNLG